MKINVQSTWTKLSGASMLAAAFIALAPGVCRAEPARVYTNKDLAALPAPENGQETKAAAPSGAKSKAKAPGNAAWKEPLPTQSAPVATGEIADWDAIWAFIERQRAAESKRNAELIEQQQAAMQAAPRLEDCFYGNHCYGAIYRPGYLTYPGLIVRRNCLPCDLSR